MFQMIIFSFYALKHLEGLTFNRYQVLFHVMALKKRINGKRMQRGGQNNGEHNEIRCDTEVARFQKL